MVAMYEKARNIAKNGMAENLVLEYFEEAQCNAFDNIILFEQFGISRDVTYGLYKIWIQKDDEVYLWKEFLSTLPISLEFNINF